MATWRPYLFLEPNDNTVLCKISKFIQDNHKVTIDDGKEVIYEVSFGTIVFDLE